MESFGGGLLLLFVLLPGFHEITKHGSKFHWEDVLGRCTQSQTLQGFKILQGHGLGIDCLGNRVNLVQSR